jgi:PhzF family phenazine biosynthesis protein
LIELPLFQIGAFADELFAGNPAAVCPLPVMLSTNVLQSLAAENNLSETAFIVGMPEDDPADFLLRWFTPTTEVDICGHATLVTAHIVLTHMQPDKEQVVFTTRSGLLTVKRDGDRYKMDFPALKPIPYGPPEGLGAAMGAEPVEVLKSDKADRDLLLIYKDAATIEKLDPNQEALKAFAPFGFIATAAGEGDYDFVSRCFFPNHGIAEDPVTGSAHCVSGPYWAEKLGKNQLFARQMSARGGDVWVGVEGERVSLAGHAVEYMQGVYLLPE